MRSLRSVAILIMCSVATAALGQTTNGAVPASCPITKATAAPFTPPDSYLRPEAWGDPSAAWYGTSKLWTSVPPDGHWHTGPRFLPKAVFREKLFWWRIGYDPYREGKPNLMVTAEQLDGTHKKFKIDNATNAIRAGSPAMLVLIDVPTVGCWKITGRYADAELSYVVWVGQ